MTKKITMIAATVVMLGVLPVAWITSLHTGKHISGIFLGAFVFIFALGIYSLGKLVYGWLVKTAENGIRQK